MPYPTNAYSEREASQETARYWPLVTKADSALPQGVTRGLWVGTAGTANLMDADGNIESNVPLLAGFNPFQCKQVRTGGTAADIRAMY